LVTTMSSLTNDWIQNISHNKVRLFVFIDDFGEKMNEYSTNKFIRSDIILINKSRFAVDIYPNGIGGADSHVAVFLSNLSDSRVCIEYKISPETFLATGGCGKKIVENVRNRHNAGYLRKSAFIFLPHCERSKWLPDGSLLKIVVDVELLCEETRFKNDEILTLQPTDFKIEEAEISMKEPKSCVSEKNQELVKEVEYLKSIVSKLTSSVEQLTEIALGKKSDTLRIDWPECPICHERIKKPMRLKQCVQGHIVCEACLRDETKCYTCKEVISGRPSALEHILEL